MINVNKVLPNSIFILEASENRQDMLYELGNTYNVTIEGGGKIYELKVVEICVSQFNISQAILRPILPLDTGINYSLLIQYRSKNTRVSQLLKNKLIVFESQYFKVSSHSNFIKPRFLSTPKYLSKSMKHFGCGPEYFVKFSLRHSNTTDVIIKTTVKDLKTNFESTYYILPNENSIEIGRNMCFGAFIFEDDTKYEVQFQIMDFQGNLSEVSNPIVFTKPINIVDE